MRVLSSLMLSILLLTVCGPAWADVPVNGTWSFGHNNFGQLGIAAIGPDQLSPVGVRATSGTGYLLNIKGLSSAWYHSLALRSDGTVVAWGRNVCGELGDGTIVDRTRPTPVKGPTGSGLLTNIVALSANNEYSLAVAGDGSLWGWGYNYDGQLGDGTLNERHLPVQVKGLGGAGYLANVKRVAAGVNHALALTADGSVYAWGANDCGQLGDPTTTATNVPVQVKGPGGAGFLAGAVAIAAGDGLSVAVLADGSVWAWGRNDRGQLGNGSYDLSLAPVQVLDVGGGPATLSGIKDVACGWYFVAALRTDGTLRAWGQNTGGQLGNNTIVDSALPVEVRNNDNSAALAGISAIAAGYQHVLALRTGKTVCAWGANWSGQLGDGTTTSRTLPIDIPGLANIIALSGGQNASVTAAALPTQDYALTVNNGTGSGSYAPATVVSIAATVPAGQNFVAWTGDVAGVANVNAASTTITLTANATVTATFAPINFLLTVNDGAGSGSYPTGTVVSIAATIPAGQSFVTWTGDVAGVADVNAASTSITLTANATVTATFAPINFLLTVHDGAGSGSYAPGTVVSIAATIPTGQSFVAWTGDVAGVADVNAASTTITINANAAITATFALINFSLTVNDGAGSGSYPTGTVVSIAATVPAGQNFVAWTGDVAGVADVNAASTTITINANAAITATFAPVVVTVQGTLSRDWVYQNTPSTTANRHVVYLTLTVSGSASYIVGVAKGAASVGNVGIESTADPLVWAIRGSARQAGGLIGTGAVTLNVTVTDNPSGAVGTRQVSVTSRALGDIDGAGGLSGLDKLMINKRLSGLVPDGPEFDLDGVGGANGLDKLIINKILTGLLIP